MRNTTIRSTWRAAAIAAAAGSAGAVALGQGAGVVPTDVARGAATFSGRPGDLVIRASDGAIINYARFDIGAGESVRFIQPGEAARVLNRVQSVDPSIINGSLSANGVVYLVNPSGVIFGPDSVISAAGLVAAAGAISDADFAAGVDRFVTSGGVVTHRGVIDAERFAHLVGARVEQLGSIVAPEGVVTMSAGETVYLGEAGGRLMVQVEGGPAGAESVQAPALRHAGETTAGEVLFTTGDVYALALGGRTKADRIAAKGGAVALESATVDASRDGRGGDVRLEGRVVFVDHDSQVRADAIGTGAGGEVWILAQDAAGVYGDVSARGATGEGGFVETSAMRALRVERAPDVSSERGPAGEWLIDPIDLEIVLDGLGSAGIVATPDGFASSAVGARIEAGTIVAGLLLGDVTLETAGAGPEPGEIRLLATLDFDGVSGSTLTLRAHDDIVLDRDILDSTFGDGDALNLRLIANADGVGGGGIFQNRDLELGGGALHATGDSYQSTPTSEIIAASALIDVQGAAVVPGRVFLTGALDVRAMDAVTFQPGAIIAGELDSRSGLDGAGDTLFAAGDLQINAPVIAFSAGTGAAGTAQVRIADNAPQLQGALFGSLPSDFAIAQSAAITSADLPALADFGAGVTNLAAMDYTLTTLGSGRDVAVGAGGLTGADLRINSAGDASLDAMQVGALIVNAAGEVALSGAIVASGGVHRGTAVEADLSGQTLASPGTLAADAVGLAFTGDATLVTAGDATLVDPLAGASGAGGDLRVTSLGGRIAQGAGASTLAARDAQFIAESGSINLDALDASGLVRFVSAGDATVDHVGDLRFGGGATDVGGELSATSGGSVTDQSAVQVVGDARFDAAGSIDLDELDATGAVFLDSALFASVTNARTLTLGTSTVGGDLTAPAATGAIEDVGAVTAAGAATFETLGAGDVALDTTTAAGGFTLATAAGNATLAGDTLTLNNATISGDFVLDANAYDLAGDAAAAGAATLTGLGEATGPGDQLVSAGADLAIDGPLVKATSGDLTLQAGGLLTLGGDVSADAGSLLLNPAGRTDVPDRATIVGRPDAMGELRLAASDRVEIGRREKLTVLGSLAIEAGAEAIVGDVNTLGDLAIRAPQLTLLARDGARLLVAVGTGVELSDDPDGGVDLVAGGEIDLDGAIVVDRESAGDAAPLLANDGDRITGAGGLETREFDAPLTLSDLVASGVVLDLEAPPAGDAPNPAGLDDDLLSEGLRDIDRAPELDPALADELSRLGVPARQARNPELISRVSGRGLYDDVSIETGGAAAVRLSGAVARDLVARYDALAGREFENAPVVRERLAALYEAFLEQADADERDSVEALAAYLRTSGASDELNAIADIVALLSNLGLTGWELVEARDALLGRFAPQGLSTERLGDAARRAGAA